MGVLAGLLGTGLGCHCDTSSEWLLLLTTHPLTASQHLSHLGSASDRDAIGRAKMQRLGDGTLTIDPGVTCPQSQSHVVMLSFSSSAANY